MQASKILVAMDDCEASRQILPTVAAKARDSESVRLLLCHLLPPLPPELLESRGAEKSKDERRIERKQESAQAEWIGKQTEEGQRLLAEAKKTLEALDVAGERIETEVTEPIDSHEMLADAIVELARARDCGTIALGRHSFSFVKKVLYAHLGDVLQRRADGLDIWIIE